MVILLLIRSAIVFSYLALDFSRPPLSLFLFCIFPLFPSTYIFFFVFKLPSSSPFPHLLLCPYPSFFISFSPLFFSPLPPCPFLCSFCFLLFLFFFSPSFPLLPFFHSVATLSFSFFLLLLSPIFLSLPFFFSPSFFSFLYHPFLLPVPSLLSPSPLFFPAPPPHLLPLPFLAPHFLPLPHLSHFLPLPASPSKRFMFRVMIPPPTMGQIRAGIMTVMLIIILLLQQISIMTPARDTD